MAIAIKMIVDLLEVYSQHSKSSMHQDQQAVCQERVVMLLEVLEDFITLLC